MWHQQTPHGVISKTLFSWQWQAGSSDNCELSATRSAKNIGKPCLG